MTSARRSTRPATAVARSSVSKKGAASRETILRASTEVFSRRGFAAATMREIAEHAGTPLSAFYYYFSSKHEVLAAIMDSVLAALDRACVEAMREAEGPSAQLAAMVAGHVRVHLQDPEAARVADGELRLLDEQVRADVVARRDAYEAHFRRVLEEGRRTGEFAADLDVSVATMSILMMSTGVVEWWRPGGRLGVDDTAEMLGRFAVSAVLTRPS